MSFYGENIKLNIYGQSHAPEIGMSLEGIPSGAKLDMAELRAFLERRAPGRSRYMSGRRERDIPEFLSGLKDDTFSGGIINAVIRNIDARPADYEKNRFIPRPGHADYTAYIKYGPAHGNSGGGAFSGRMTAPLCIAGGICLQLLKKEGIEIISRLYSVGSIKDEGELDISVREKDFPTMSSDRGEKMLSLIDRVKSEGDSVGGVIECCALNVPAGLGGPLFEGMEGRISSAAFAIPGVKGIDFGAGVKSAELRGSENNDPFIIKEGRILTEGNNCGGILGGITDGMPLSFRLYMKPTPSIAKEQRSVNLESMEPCTVSTCGRHDPCIALRALPCAEAAAALAIYDALLSHEKESL